MKTRWRKLSRVPSLLIHPFAREMVRQQVVRQQKDLSQVVGRFFLMAQCAIDHCRVVSRQTVVRYRRMSQLPRKPSRPLVLVEARQLLGGRSEEHTSELQSQ